VTAVEAYELTTRGGASDLAEAHPHLLSRYPGELREEFGRE
jgi:hypothetical protein